MQVFINGRFASQVVTGVQRYAEELLRALDRELGRVKKGTSELSFHILAPRSASRLPGFEHISVREVGRFGGHAWEQLELPWYARGGLLVNLTNTGPLLHREQIVTIHDASAFAVPQAYSLAFRWWYRILLPALGRVARRVVTDSEFSKSELIRYARINGHKLRVIALSGEHILNVESDCSILKRLGLLPRSYVLAVSSHSRHKNFKVVAEAMAHLGPESFDVVAAGGHNPRVFGSPVASLGPSLKLVGYVSDGELRALYENAGCFVYPSLYEGFGLPPLEAMTCGCPTIVSQEASLPEVCGDAAVYCDARNASSVAGAVDRVMRDGALQDQLRSAGRRRASQFTWARSARDLLALIHEVSDS